MHADLTWLTVLKPMVVANMSEVSRTSASVPGTKLLNPVVYENEVGPSKQDQAGNDSARSA